MVVMGLMMNMMKIMAVMQIVERNSELEYRDESGGLNEAFADMTGKVADSYIKGTSPDPIFFFA